MRTLSQYIEQRDKTKHTCRSEEDAVKDAIDILVDNRFTGIDIVTLLTAKQDVIEKALDTKFYPHGHEQSRPRQRE